MRQRGMLLTCDRCGKQIMLTAEIEHNTDGGYPKSVTYSDEPDDWTKHEGKDLCDECNKYYEMMIEKFYKDVEFEKHICEDRDKNPYTVVRDLSMGVY